MKKFIVLTFVLFIVYPALLFSQQTGGLKIIVRDSTTKETMPYVTIRILNTKVGINSSIGDFYLLKNIPVGKQTIQATAVGYKRTQKTIEIKPDEMTFVNIFLSPEPVMLPSVVQTAERIKEMHEANISVQTITPEQINLIPMVVEKDLFRALKIIPGVSSTGDATSRFYVRGGGGDQNLIIFDNMVIYNPYHAMGIFSIFNSDAIKNSEIATGGFSPEFGGRLSSVINITSRDGNRNNYSGKINIGMLSGNAFLEGPLPSGAFYLALRKSLFDAALKKIVGKEVPLSFYDISGKATFDLSSTAKISTSFIGSSDNLENKKETEPNYNWNNYAVGLNLNSFIAQFLATTSFSYSNFKIQEDPKKGAENTNLKSTLENLNFNLKLDYLQKSNDLISIGFSIFQQDMSFSYQNSYGFLTQSVKSVQELNFWARYKLTQIDNFIAEVGIRDNVVNNDGRTFYNLEPRINLKYQLFKGVSLKGSFSRMHQPIISTSNEDDLIPLFEAWIPIDKTYYPERADQYVIGTDLIFLDNFNLTVQYYRKYIWNYFEYNIDRQTRYDQEFVSGSGESSGLEMLLRFDYGQFYGWFGYNYNISDKTVGNFIFPPRYHKKNNFNMILGARLDYDIDISLHWEVNSGMPFTPISGYYDWFYYPNVPNDLTYNNSKKNTLYGYKNSSRLPSYHRMDFNISKAIIISGFPKMKIAVDLINIYDHKNIFYFNKETMERVDMIPFMTSLSFGIEI